MGIVEQLREGKTNGSHLRWNVTAIHLKSADLIERLKAYTEHEPDCPSGGYRPLPDEHCRCGLTALIKEIDGE